MKTFTFPPGFVAAPFTNGEIDLHSTGIVWDDPDFDNSGILHDLIVTAAAEGKTLKCRLPGTIYVGVCDVAVQGHVLWDFVPGLWFHGLPDFEGAVVSVRGHTPDGNRTDDFQAKNFWVDNSERPFAPGATGTGLAIFNFNYAYTENFRGFAGTDFRMVDGVAHGDSAMTQNTVNSSLHLNFAARGQPDLGFYGTADPPIPGDPAGPDHPGDPSFLNRGGHTMINPRFLDCSQGMKFTRGGRRLRIIGGEAIRCGCGIFLPDMSGQASPGNADLSSDHFFNTYEFIVDGFMGKRCNAFIRIGPGQRGSILGCQIEDWGYQPTDGTIESGTAGSIRAAYSLEGASQTHWNGCRAWFRDWDPIDEGDVDRWLFGFRCRKFTSDAASGSVVYECHDNVFEGCLIEGSNRAYYEEDLTHDNRGVIYARGGSTKGVQLRPGSSSQVVDGDTPLNSTVAQTDDHPGSDPLVLSSDSARIQLLRGAKTVDQFITFDTDIMMWGKEFHFDNQTTGDRTTLINITGGNVALAPNQWCDINWSGTELRLLRFGTNMLREDRVLDFPSIAAHSYENVTTTVTTAVPSDSVVLGLRGGGGGNGVAYKGWCGTDNTITVQAMNVTDAAIDPGSQHFNITVLKGPI